MTHELVPGVVSSGLCFTDDGDDEAAKGGSRYHHIPLDDPSKQVRLLRLIAMPAILSTARSDSRKMIACEVKTYDLADMRDKFTALSYTWGAQEHRLPIIINSRYFWVSENLCELLESMNQGAHERRIYTMGSCPKDWRPLHSRTALFWIDQICIDQSHTNERNHQVKIMSSIYKSAENVIIWLRARDNSDEGVLADISQNEYWSRLCIIQEIMLAKSLRLLQADTLWHWQQLRDQLRRKCPNIVNRKVIPSIMTNKFALHRALELFSAQRCHDPRDKVYGLMGIVHEKERIDIDYNKEASEIYWDAIAGVRTKELKDPDRIIELGREMGVTGEEEVDEQVEEKIRSLFGGKDPKALYQKT